MIPLDVKVVIANIAILLVILAATTLSYCFFLVKLDDWVMNKRLKKQPSQGKLILLYFAYLSMALFAWYLIAE